MATRLLRQPAVLERPRPDVLAEIAALRQENVTLRQEMAALRLEIAPLLAMVPRDHADTELRTAIASSTEGRRFTAKDLIRHATVNPALATALEAACISGPLELGVWLRDHAGLRDQIVIERVRRPRRWCVRVCTSAR